MGLLERQIALDYIYPKSGAPQGHLFLIFWGCKKLELLQIKINYEFTQARFMPIVALQTIRSRLLILRIRQNSTAFVKNRAFRIRDVLKVIQQSSYADLGLTIRQKVGKLVRL